MVGGTTIRVMGSAIISLPLSRGLSGNLWEFCLSNVGQNCLSTQRIAKNLVPDDAKDS